VNTWMTAIQIKNNEVEGFLAVSADFAGACLREPGLVSFALLRQLNAPANFSLFEVYHDEQAWQAHINSEHFRTWQTFIAPLLDLPLTPQPYTPIFPPPEDWERHLEE